MQFVQEGLSKKRKEVSPLSKMGKFRCILSRVKAKIEEMGNSSAAQDGSLGFLFWPKPP
jgi:hypothetical protein